MIIERPIYLNRLKSRVGNGMIKVITGLRRCGKSFLLFHLFKNDLLHHGVKQEQMIEILLDDEDFAAYRDPDKMYAYIKSRMNDPDKTYYILIDEAQFAISKEEMSNRDKPIRLYGVLNGLLRKSNAEVFITGSNSKFLSSDVMTEFRGRGDEIHIGALAFSEFLPACGQAPDRALREYMYYGGLPHILAEQGQDSKVRYLTRLNEEIYLKDICERYGLRNPDGMEDLMKYTASAIGSLSNPRKLADTFRSHGEKGLSEPTISNYLSYLQESFMLEKAERYDIKGRKFIGSPYKYYFTDMGLRNAFLNFRQFEATHIMENIIYNELIYRGYNVDVGIVDGTYRTDDGKYHRKQYEVDFVANLGSRRYYIQSAYSLPTQEKIDQEQASFIRIPDSFHKIIISGDNTPVWHTEKGMTVIGLIDFLTNTASLDQ